jgi:hypothetical protein
MADERMTNNGGTDVRRWTRFLVVLLLLSLVGGGIGEGWIPQQLIVRNDAAATVQNLTTSSMLHRLGFAVYLIEAMCDVMIALAFYVILRPVHRNIALLSAFFGLVSTAVYAVSQSLFMLPTIILRNPAPFAAFSPDQLNALVLLSVRAFGYVGGLFLVFYGVASVLRGWLIYKSGYLPAWLGILLMLGGLGFMTNSYLLVLAPGRGGMLFLLPMFVAMAGMLVWFSFKGVDMERWRMRTTDVAA